MDISRLKKKNLRVWLPMMDGVEVLCCHLSQPDFDAISAACITTKFDNRTHRRLEERDDKKFRAELGKAIVEDWRGIDDEGKPYPCTPENVVYLMEECTEFRLLVMDAPLSLERMLAAEKEELGKNSLTTSAPALTSQE